METLNYPEEWHPKIYGFFEVKEVIKMAVTYVHQELMEQMIVLTVAVLKDDSVDIEDFIEWAKDTYMAEDDSRFITADIAIHRIRQDMNTILKLIRKERDES